VNNLPLYHAKFGFIVICFLIALYYKKPFAALFTMWADFFLVIRLQNETGVTIFVAAHLCYIVRFTGSKRLLPFCMLFAIPAFVASRMLGEQFGTYLVFISTIYAQCFLLSLSCALYSFFRKRFPRPNGVFIVTGMLLFMLCDICVLIFNISTSEASYIAFGLIWVFYAPSQLLLALSARKFELHGNGLLHQQLR